MCIAGFDMKKKKLLACSVLCGLIIGCGLAVIFKDKTEKTPVSEVTEKKIKQEPVKEEIKVTPPAPVQKPVPKEIVKKAYLVITQFYRCLQLLRLQIFHRVFKMISAN